MATGRGPVRRLFRLGVGRPQPDEAVEWEIEHYVEERTERLIEEGWEPAEARAEAERLFGRRRYGPRLRRLERRRVVMRTTTGWMDFLRQGMEWTARGLRRQPGFAAGVIVTLALGIGANAAMFGIVDRLLLRPPDHVEDHEEVRRIILDRGEWVGGTITYPDFMDLRAHGGFESVAAYGYAKDLTVGEGPEAYRLKGVAVSHEFFPLLGAEPVMGRTFTPDEDRPGAPGTVIVSRELWRDRFGGGPEVLGSTLELSGHPYTVIGVAPAGFTGVGLSKVDLWLPIEATEFIEQGGTEWKDGQWARGSWWLSAVARLGDGVTIEAAEEQATALHLNGRREQIEAGRYYATPRIRLRDLIAARGEDPSDESKVAQWLGAVSLVVLLIACANVANLLLARGARRRREVAVRLALGVSRGRLVGQHVLETMALALSGGVLALAVARWGGGVVRRTLLPNVYFPDSAVDGRVVAFTLLVSLAAGLLAGLGPALQSSRADVADALAEGGRGASGRRSHVRSALVVAQATLSLVLLVGAGLFVRSLARVQAIDLGLDTDRIVLAMPELAADDVETAEKNRLYREAAERLRSVPGVEAVAATNAPFQWGYATSLEVPGLDSLPRLPGGGPYFYSVTPDYFRAMGISLVLGRGIEESDGNADAPVTVVSRTMAETLWPEASALGRCLMIGEDEACTTVVGVVEDASRGSLETEPYMAYYLPASQRDHAMAGLYARVATGAEVGEVALGVADALRTTPGIRYATARTLTDLLDPQARSWKLGATMFSVFGLLALLVASVGLYSVLSFEVAQRTREIGVRGALGATRPDLLRGVVLDGVRLILIGTALGLAIAWTVAPRIGDLLFEVEPRDPAVMAAVGAVLLASAVVAGLVPGVRATRVDPSVALRAE